MIKDGKYSMFHPFSKGAHDIQSEFNRRQKKKQQPAIYDRATA